MLANYHWAWDLPLTVANTPTDSQLEKTNFLFSNRYQLWIESWLGVGPCLKNTVSLDYL